MARRFRWLPHDGGRHAVPVELVAGADGATLCGLAVTVPSTSPPRHPHGCWPTCPACDTAWRRAEGIPLPSERRRASGPPGRARAATAFDVHITDRSEVDES
ncbi:hypothetical protein GCM10022243_19470 [Saccharothrix violaceirubra]|uniref:Zinc finger protein n=1 Tax=Saccharothrix violaceirubra TaxID=413306 RepID=A0A7W7WVJ4_9PSEU|nr:zinc finger protein [Saccharothrix violaceirubra]MBB4965146.1 hypothetical protein [Saccharothrix violaceirubra]